MRSDHGALVGEMLVGEVGALRLLERAHPFGDVVILDFGELLEIAENDRARRRGHLIRAKFCHGGGEVDNRVIRLGQ